MGTEAVAVIATVAAIVTAVVIYWQGSLLKGQIELQTLIDLEAQWNAPEMRRMRASVFAVGAGDRLNRLERVLEFLENFATYHKRGALSSRRVWDSNLGWYASRYCFYHDAEIDAIRDQWRDETLYKSLRDLRESYVRTEAGIRRVAVSVIEGEFAATKPQFVALETQGFEEPR